MYFFLSLCYGYPYIDIEMRYIMTIEIHSRYIAHAGFVTTPRYFDDSPQQFLQIAPPRTGILQRVNHISNYGYELKERSDHFSLLEESALCLAQSYCQVVGQVGTNWVHCNGTSPDDIRRICGDISDNIGVPFFMAGQCLVDGLKEIGAKTITIMNGYYRDDWSAGINRYLEQAGFKILWAGDLIAQDIVKNNEEKLAIEKTTYWDYPDHIMIESAIDAIKRAPEADAIVQTGAGFRMMQVVDAIEGATKKPVIASDFALYWAMLKALKLPASHGYGLLLSTLNS